MKEFKILIKRKNFKIKFAERINDIKSRKSDCEIFLNIYVPGAFKLFFAVIYRHIFIIFFNIIPSFLLKI